MDTHFDFQTLHQAYHSTLTKLLAFLYIDMTTLINQSSTMSSLSETHIQNSTTNSIKCFLEIVKSKKERSFLLHESFLDLTDYKGSISSPFSWHKFKLHGANVNFISEQVFNYSFEDFQCMFRCVLGLYNYW